MTSFEKGWAGETRYEEAMLVSTIERHTYLADLYKNSPTTEGRKLFARLYQKFVGIHPADRLEAVQRLAARQ